MAKKRKQYPSQARLRELFDYDPEGFLVWKYRQEKSKQWNGRFAGNRAGSIRVRKDGHIEASSAIDGVQYNTLYLVWIFHKGAVPDGYFVKTKGSILEGIKICDMYLSDKQGILRSGGRIFSSRDNGVVGVYQRKDKESTSFVAAAFAGGKTISLGSYFTEDAAAAAYNEWAKEYYGEGFIPNETKCSDPDKYRIDTNHRQNKRNQKSGYKGVYLTKRIDRFVSAIVINKNRKHLGTFPTKEQAARAYNKAAYEHYGENAVLNDIPDPLGLAEPEDGDAF